MPRASRFVSWTRLLPSHRTLWNQNPGMQDPAQAPNQTPGAGTNHFSNPNGLSIPFQNPAYLAPKFHKQKHFIQRQSHLQHPRDGLLIPELHISNNVVLHTTKDRCVLFGYAKANVLYELCAAATLYIQGLPFLYWRRCSCFISRGSWTTIYSKTCISHWNKGAVWTRTCHWNRFQGSVWTAGLVAAMPFLFGILFGGERVLIDADRHWPMLAVIFPSGHRLSTVLNSLKSHLIDQVIYVSRRQRNAEELNEHICNNWFVLLPCARQIRELFRLILYMEFIRSL